MLEAFQRSDYQTSMHDDFHNDEATAHWPRVGNWNLALTGSLLCPFLRVKYNNVRKLGDFMESFTVCKAREQPVADWFPQYTELVQLVSDLVGACSQAVHDSLQWNMNPAELIHTIRVSEIMEKKTQAGRGGGPQLTTPPTRRPTSGPGTSHSTTFGDTGTHKATSQTRCRSAGLCHGRGGTAKPHHAHGLPC